MVIEKTEQSTKYNIKHISFLLSSVCVVLSFWTLQVI